MTLISRRRNHRKRIIVEGYYGCGSVGDEAILDGLLTILKEIDPVETIVISHDPENTRAVHHVETVGRGLTEWILKIPRYVMRSDCFVFGGGNLLHDNAFYTLPFVIARIFLVKSFRKRFFICAQGIGPMNTRFGRILLKIGANLADTITVRDPMSAIYLNRMGIQNSLTADTTFAVKLDRGKELNSSLSDEELAKDERPLIGVALRSPLYFEHFEPENFEDAMARVADYLVKRFQARILFVPMLRPKHAFAHYPRILIDDLTVALSVLTRMKNRGDARVISSEACPNQLINLFSKFDLLIGVPLHSLIFSTMAGTPFIGMNYHSKVRSYFRMIEYDEAFQVNVDQISSQTLIEKVEHIWPLRQRIRKRLSSIARVLRGRAHANVRGLLEILE